MLIYLEFGWRCCVCVSDAMSVFVDCEGCSVWLTLYPRTIRAEVGTESQHKRTCPWDALAVASSPDGPPAESGQCKRWMIVFHPRVRKE